MPLVGALLLAAGRGSRMGGNKLVRPLDGTPVARRTAEAVIAAGLPCIAVLGAHAEAVHTALPAEVPTTFAADHAAGQSASLRAGIAALPDDWMAALVCLADMPWVQAATYAALAAELKAGAQAVAPLFDGRRGNPVGFARALWPDLMALTGDRGAGPMLASLGDRLRLLPVDDAGVLRDADVPEDLS